MLTPAVIVFFIGTYLTAIVGTPAEFQPVYWIARLRRSSSASTCVGVELSFKVTVIVTLLALACLAVFYVGAIPVFDFGRWALNIGADR